MNAGYRGETFSIEQTTSGLHHDDSLRSPARGEVSLPVARVETTMAPTGAAATDPSSFNKRDPTEISLRKLMGKVAQATLRSDETADIEMLRTNKEYDSGESYPSIDGEAHHVYPTVTVTIDGLGEVTVHPNIHKAEDEIEFFGYAVELDITYVDDDVVEMLPVETIGYDSVNRKDNGVTARTQSTVAFSNALDTLVDTVEALRRMP